MLDYTLSKNEIYNYSHLTFSKEMNKKFFHIKAGFSLNKLKSFPAQGIVRRDSSLEKKTKSQFLKIFNTTSIDKIFEEYEKEFSLKKEGLIVKHLTNKILHNNAKLAQTLSKNLKSIKNKLKRLTLVEVIPVNLYSLDPLEKTHSSEFIIKNNSTNFSDNNKILIFTDIKENHLLYSVLPCVESNFDEKTAKNFKSSIFKNAERNIYLSSMLHQKALQVGPWKFFAGERDDLNDLTHHDATLLSKIYCLFLALKDCAQVEDFAQLLIFDVIFGESRKNYTLETFHKTKDFQLQKEFTLFFWKKITDYGIIVCQNSKLIYNEQNVEICSTEIINEIEQIYFKFLQHNCENVCLKNRKKLNEFVIEWKQNYHLKSSDTNEYPSELLDVFERCKEVPTEVDFTPVFEVSPTYDNKSLSFA